MTATSLIKAPVGEWLISFDTGVEDEYDIIDLGSSDLEKKYEKIIDGRKNEKIVHSKLYNVVVTNKEKTDGVFIIFQSWNEPMHVDKNEFYRDGLDKLTPPGAIKGKSSPYTIDNTEGIIREISFPDKSKPVSIGRYITTPGRVSTPV
jgi:hypothetical protein